MFSSKKIIKRGAPVEVQDFIAYDELPRIATAGEAWKLFSEGSMLDEASAYGGSATAPASGDEGYQQEEDAGGIGTEEQEEEKEYSEEELAREQMLADAREEAARIMAEAEAEKERLLAEAREEGYNEGFQKGLEAGKSEAERKLTEEFRKKEEDFQKDVRMALSEVDRAKKESLRMYLDELKEIAIKVAEKVIHVSLRSSGEVIKRMILNEAEKMRRSAWLKIYIDKTDYQMMVRADANVASELSRVSDNIKFVVMERDDSGNVILETPDEIVDMGVKTQMENLRERLGQVEPG